MSKKKKEIVNVNKKLVDLSRKELLKIAESILMPINNPEQYKEMVKSNMPDFVREMNDKEDMATSIWQANQELILVLADCLRRYHRWSQLEIRQLHKELYEVLTGVKEFEDAGLSFLSPHDVATLGDKVEEVGISGLMKQIATARYNKAKIIRAGLEVPILPQANAIMKQLTRAK